MTENVYPVTPQFYCANPHFMNTIRFSIDFSEPIKKEALEQAIKIGMKRYPYYCVRMRKNGEHIELVSNDLPFVLSDNGATVCLGEKSSNYHLLAFSYEDKTLYIDISHFIADGTGVIPLVKTIAYYYLTAIYDDIYDTSNIWLLDDEILPDEYEYPFPKEPIPAQQPFPQRIIPKDGFLPDRSAFDDQGAYAYLLKINQSEFMKIAKNQDGSPASFLSVMMFRAFCRLHPEYEGNFVCTLPHQYRATLGRPLSHDCLSTIVHILYKSSMKNWDVSKLNTIARGQIIYSIDINQNLQTINSMVQLGAYMEHITLAMKKQIMLGSIKQVALNNASAVSYIGKTDWGGMEKYIKNVYLFAGEQKRGDTIGMEVLTIGDDFTICLMQRGKGEKYVNAFIQELNENGINVHLYGQKRYSLCSFAPLPE